MESRSSHYRSTAMRFPGYTWHRWVTWSAAIPPPGRRMEVILGHRLTRDFADLLGDTYQDARPLTVSTLYRLCLQRIMSFKQKSQQQNQADRILHADTFSLPYYCNFSDDLDFTSIPLRRQYPHPRPRIPMQQSQALLNPVSEQPIAQAPPVTQANPRRRTPRRRRKARRNPQVNKFAISCHQNPTQQNHPGRFSQVVDWIWNAIFPPAPVKNKKSSTLADIESEGETSDSSESSDYFDDW